LHFFLLVPVQAEHAGGTAKWHPQTHKQKREKIIGSEPGAFGDASQ
jgi:hypothetical protein